MAQTGIARMSRRQLLRRGITAASLTALAGTAYTTLVEPAWIEVTHVTLRLPRLAPAFCGYRVAQVSDIHLGDWMNVGRFRDVIRAVNGQAPDVIAITGDFVTRRAEQQAGDLAIGLRQLRARDRVVAVLGNHDYWSNPRIIRDLLPASGVRELANDIWTIRRGDAQLHITGVDDIWEERDRLDLVLDGLPRDGAAVLLAHEPDFAETSAASGRFDLQISGHSHGGQIKFPGCPPIHTPAFARHYREGWERGPHHPIYVTRGIGTMGIPMRFGCPPEVTVIEIHPA